MKFQVKVALLVIIAVLVNSIQGPLLTAKEKRKDNSLTASLITDAREWIDNSKKSIVSGDWAKWTTKWLNVKNNYEQLALTPGETENDLNFAWYSRTPNEAKVQIAKTVDMKNPIYFVGSSTRCSKINGTIYYSNKVSATDLKNKTEYYYQYYLNGEWSQINKYKTKNPEKFTVLFTGDPQIGASVGRIAAKSKNEQTAAAAAKNDSFSWITTLQNATEANPVISFIISSGDQVNNMGNGGKAANLQQETEYAGFLAPDILGSIPIAPAIGNHDALTANYQNHFNNPNIFKEEKSPSKAGNDYYFTYGHALFIFLNTNNHNFSDHDALLKKATEANKDAVWRIVTYHHDIYGSGIHSSSDTVRIRPKLTKLMDKYDIDVVLQGHDHSYTRSCQLSSGEGKKPPTATPGKSPTVLQTTPPMIPPNNPPMVWPGNSPTVPASILPEVPSKPPTVSPDIPPTVSPDTPPTVSPDIPPTVSPDTPPTVSPDIPPTVSPDTPQTVSPDIPPTVSPDIPPTVSPDTPQTVSPDTPPTVSPDTPPTVTPYYPPTVSPDTPPTVRPYYPPTIRPKNSPTVRPYYPPTVRPKNSPTVRPYYPPTIRPKNSPTVRPYYPPTIRPKNSPTIWPYYPPTIRPDNPPKMLPCISVNIQKRYNSVGIQSPDNSVIIAPNAPFVTSIVPPSIPLFIPLIIFSYPNTEKNFCYHIVTDAKAAADNIVTDPEGVLYITATSATGSKFYNLNFQKQKYVAYRVQTWEPYYTIIEVNNNKLVIKTYNVFSNKKIDDYTIQKTSK